MHFLAVKGRVLQGFQDPWQLLETSAVFLMCMPLEVCCTPIYGFLSTVNPDSDGQKGELLTDLCEPVLAVAFKQSVQWRAQIFM